MIVAFMEGHRESKRTPPGYSFLQNRRPSRHKARRVSGVLFDFDGTLTSPAGLDFAAIRAAIGCPADQTILEFINSRTGAERDQANRILEEFERQAAREAKPNEGCGELFAFLRSRGLPIGIITRNLRSSVLRSLENFPGIRAEDFRVILTREEAFAPKPDPEGIRVAAENMQIPVEELLMVGDFRFDIEAGTAAGSLTAFLANRDSGPLPELLGNCDPDFTVLDLYELTNLVRYLLPLPNGKLPNDILQVLLAGVRDDDSVLVGPSTGEDFAALKWSEADSVLVLKSDPITFTTDRVGFYSVIVNTNDLATSGCRPRWFMATLLFPPGSTAAEVHDCVDDLDFWCSKFGLILCGGHTEITPAVRQQTVVGFAAGTARLGKLLRKQQVEEGDIILMTKGAGIEGTAILARELETRLLTLGATREELERSRAFEETPGISVVREAALAAQTGGISGMHDVTEGGVATALEELATACDHSFRVCIRRIPVLAETAAVCFRLGLNPLGLIGSGALLICCRSDSAEAVVEAIRAAGIQVTQIGEVLARGKGVTALDENGNTVPWPKFERDEIARAMG